MEDWNWEGDIWINLIHERPLKNLVHERTDQLKQALTSSEGSRFVLASFIGVSVGYEVG